MAKELTYDTDFLLFRDQRPFIANQLGTDPYTCVYNFGNDQVNTVTVFTGLLKKSQIKRALSTVDWEISLGDGLPCCCRHGAGSNAKVTYDRFGHNDAEPLIFVRNFDFQPSYPEVSEEFRLFHNLHFNDKRNEYVKFDESGNEEAIIKYSSDRILIRTRELREYLSVRKRHLAIYFDVFRSSHMSLKEIPEDQILSEVHEKEYCYQICITGNSFGTDDYLTHSNLRGKKIINPLSKSKVSVWPYEEQKQEKFQEFIIGVDKDGENIYHTCDPDKLANFFGKNPKSPQYLTPIFFKREVLQKYYGNSSVFSVEDSFLRCGSTWGLRMDNHQPDVVIAYLGDIGKQLPESERVYWLHFNIPPTGKTSRVKYLRDFMAVAAEPEGADLLFKQEYKYLNEAWQKKYSWFLFRELAAQDKHFFQNLRLLLNNSQSEFDVQVLSLAKVLIDALNEADIEKRTSGLLSNSKGITKLETFLKAQGFPNIEQGVQFLRDLQSIRSTGVAHLKGSNFKNMYDRLQMDKRELKVTFEDMLHAGTAFLQLLNKQIAADQSE